MSRRWIYLFILLSFLLIITSVLLLALSSSMVNRAVKQECVLKPGSVLYQLWRDTPVPLTIEFYIFDLVNENEFRNGGKPHLVQRGPFVYREQRTKDDVRLYPNGTISYREARNFSFDRSRSSDDETFQFKTINVVYMTLINFLQSSNLPSFSRKIIAGLLSATESLVMQRTVKEYLWGYEDPLLSQLKRLLPSLVPDSQISVFATVVNEAQYETLLINSGVGNDEQMKKVGEIERFNFSSSLSIWSDPYANMINGTDSTIWHPFVDKNERIYSFMTDICRSVYVKYNHTRENPFQITTHRYTLPDEVFANSSENQGFCLKQTFANGTEQLRCLPSGMFSMTPCIHLSGSPLSIPLPIIASNPHFLAADRSVQDAVIGLEPDETHHRSFLDIEPLTGVIMNGTRRMQFNINVVNDSSIGPLANLRPLIYPMMWVNEYAEIDQPNAEMFRKKVLWPMKALTVIKYLLLGLGLSLFVLTIFLVFYQRFRGNGNPVVVVVTPVETTADETTPLIE